MLTKKEKAILVEAAEMIEKNEEIYCCFAISQLVNKDPYSFNSKLAEKFAKFYGLWDKENNESINFEYIYDNGYLFHKSEYKEARILALLTFAEIG